MDATEGLDLRGVLESIIQEAVRGILTHDLPVGGGAVEGGPLPAFWKLLLPIQDYMRTKQKDKKAPQGKSVEKGALDKIMRVIEESLAFGGRSERPLPGILDQIIHDAAQALLTINYYSDETIRESLRAVITRMRERQNKP